jgi:hypothetical protein
MLTEAWILGSIDQGGDQIRTGFTILAFASNDELARMAREVSREFRKIAADTLSRDFQAIVALSSESEPTAGGQESVCFRGSDIMACHIHLLIHGPSILRGLDPQNIANEY